MPECSTLPSIPAGRVMAHPRRCVQVRDFRGGAHTDAAARALAQRALNDAALAKIHTVEGGDTALAAGDAASALVCCEATRSRALEVLLARSRLADASPIGTSKVMLFGMSPNLPQFELFAPGAFERHECHDAYG